MTPGNLLWHGIAGISVYRYIYVYNAGPMHFPDSPHHLTTLFRGGRRNGECGTNESALRSAPSSHSNLNSHRTSDGGGGVKREEVAPFAVVRLAGFARQLLLAGLVRPEPPHLVSVLLGLQHWNQVDACPHLLASEFTSTRNTMLAPIIFKGFSVGIEGRRLVGGSVLCLADAVNELIPAVTHDHAYTEKHVAWSKAFDGEVTLSNNQS